MIHRYVRAIGRLARGVRCWLLAGALSALVGCLAGEGLDRAVVVQPPEGWTPVAADTYTVPGTPIAAWSGPEGASLVVYRTLPTPGGTAAGLAEGEAIRFDAFPGATGIERRVVRLSDGVEAARIEAVAPGHGDALAPPVTGMALTTVEDAEGTGEGEDGVGLVPTRRVSLAIPRPEATLWITWHLPESARESLMSQVERTIERMRVHGGTAAASTRAG